jgi:hypothetical protein
MVDSSRSRGEFIELVEALYRELDVEAPALGHDERAPLVMNVEVGGTRFSMTHDLEPAPDRIMLECPLGVLPPSMREGAAVNLLRWNHALRGDGGAAFAADAQTGEVVFGMCIDLAAARPAKVLEVFVQMAGVASTWRNTLLQSLTTAEDAQQMSFAAGRA